MDLKNIWGSEGKEPLRLQDIGLPKILVIVAVGIVLLVLSLPGTGGSQKKIGKQENSSDVTSEEASEQIALDAMEQYNKKIEKELCELLRKVDGVGDVQVMITLASSEERVTLQNDSAATESTGEDGTGSKRQKESATTESVLVRKDGQDTPYLVQILTPEIEGVVVVASGADSGQTDTEIIAAVQALFPVQAHKIRVMKMK